MLKIFVLLIVFIYSYFICNALSKYLLHEYNLYTDVICTIMTIRSETYHCAVSHAVGSLVFLLLSILLLIVLFNFKGKRLVPLWKQNRNWVPIG